MRRLGLVALIVFSVAAPAVPAQDSRATKPKKPPVSTAPWPEDEVLLARRTDAENRKLFQDGPPVEFRLTSQFNLINKERTPNNSKEFPGVLTVAGTDIPVRLSSRGHLRLNVRTCEFVPIKVVFPRRELEATIFEGQTTLKLGTHCRDDADFDQDALTTMMILEYMLGNTDYSIWALHNVVVVQDKKRRFFPVPYDFDLSGMVHAPYAVPDERLPLRSVTDRLYRGPCRSVDEFNAAAEPFRTHKAEMIATIDSATELNRVHKSEMKEYLDSFFRRIATPQSIKRTFVDGCSAARARI